MLKRPLLSRFLLALGLTALLAGVATAAPSRSPVNSAGGGAPAARYENVPVTSVPVLGTAQVDMRVLAAQQARVPNYMKPAERVLDLERNEHDGDPDYQAPDFAGAAQVTPFDVGQQLNILSPAPSYNFAGLDDIAMVDSSYIIIPPDVNGAVGPTKIFQILNNNARIIDKATGTVLSTVGVNTFWAPSGASPNNYTDPRSVYDPYNNRFITLNQGDLNNSTANSLCLAISDTNDPSGTWHMYRWSCYENSTYQYADFPTLGFNRDWITVSINMYNSGQTQTRRSVFMVHYPTLLSSHTATVYRADYGTSAVICGAPVITYSATCDTEYVLQRLGTTTYGLDLITGTGPAAPTYTKGSAITRPGGAWNALGTSNYYPQAAPVSGSSVCGATPCAVERSDDNVRTPPVLRLTGNSYSIWFAQNIGLPATTTTHVAAQWTQITAPGGAFVVGGRLQDTLATTTNGRPHYGYPSIAVNKNGDFILGFTRFGNYQHPGAGYAMHVAADGVGTLRDTIIYKDGLDYYHKTFSTNTGRNRWGDFSTSMVDPSDDVTLWTVQEYAKARATTDDGLTGSNASKWGTWWAGVNPGNNAFIITATTGAGGTISPLGNVAVNQGTNQTFTITPNNCYSIASVTVDGVAQGAISSYTFTNVQAAHTISATFTPNGPYSITASAGANGTISPTGTTSVSCGATQAYTITPASCYHVADVQVDGVSQGAITTYTFTNVQGSHTISATFAINGPYTVTASAGANGSISPGGVTSLSCGGSQSYTITPASCYHIVSVLVDGVSQGAISTYTFSNVQANHTISATFAITTYTIAASAGANGTISPVGTTTLNCGSSQAYTITANSGYYLSNLLVDGSSVTPTYAYTFSAVGANHTIAATFSLDVATINSGSTTQKLDPCNTSLALPVSLTRNGPTPVLGYSVTFQLGGGLTLASGTGSITEGTFLNASGGTLFNVVDHGSGLYTADCALTANCGPTGTTGTLFSVAVASSTPSGTGTITITSLKLRDCNNATLTTAVGTAGSVGIDNAPPTVAVIAPVGGESLIPGNTFTIQWTASDNDVVSGVDLALSTDGGATYPTAIATGVANSGSYAWTVPNVSTTSARVRVTAHDAYCNSASAASAANFSIGGSFITPIGPVACLTPANACLTIPVDISRYDSVGLRLFHVDFTLSSNLKLCGTTGTSVLEGTYLNAVNPNTTFFVVDNGGGSYTADGSINGTPCGATAATGLLFNIQVASNGTGTGTVTVNDVTLRDCVNNNVVPATPGAPAQIHIDAAPVTVAAVTDPQTVVETHTLTITPAATLTACATSPVSWSVNLASVAAKAKQASAIRRNSAADLPAGATFDAATGTITWTPACGTVGTYGPYTLTVTDGIGNSATTNAFSIVVTHQAGTVTVATIADPQSVEETNTLTVTPSATLSACATAPVTWSVDLAAGAARAKKTNTIRRSSAADLPAGATFDPATGTITWTPACGTVGTYGPYTLTASASTGETGTSNAFSIVVTHHAGTVTVAAIATPQTVVENSMLSITPAAPTLTDCATGPVSWTVSPTLPSGATFDAATGAISWTPACGTVNTYGPFTLTAHASTGETGSSNAFAIVVTHLAGTVTVAAIATPQTVQETQALNITPSATTTACVGTLAWTVSPALPSGASFNTSTGAIDWTPACGTAGPYGPFTLTATASTGETSSSNAFSIDVTHHAGTVTVAAIADPQTVQETQLLTITPSATLTACATAPVTWSVDLAAGAARAKKTNTIRRSSAADLPAGATFDPATGTITWTPACGTVGTYGPYTLTASASTGETGTSNAFSIVVTHHAGTVTVAAIPTPQTVVENSTLTITPAAPTLTDCATGPVSWTVSPTLPSGATFDAATGAISWTPACGTAGNYGPFTLTAHASTGETGSSNAVAIVVTHLAGTVTVAAIATPQTVQETNTLTITPSATLSACATAPLTWSVDLSASATRVRTAGAIRRNSAADLPAGATFDASTGTITWTPACGTAGTYGPYTLTAAAATGETGSSNAFSIDVLHHAGTVTVAAIADPQTVQELSTLTITPSATLTACATGPVTWSVDLAAGAARAKKTNTIRRSSAADLPAGATFDPATGTITWTPACGTAGTYGPYTLTASASTGETGTSNAFSIVVTHHAGTVTVAAIPTPQTVVENSTLSITPAAPTLTDCATGPVSWTVSPTLPSGATFDAATGAISWTPACGTAGNYGPFTLTAHASTGETGSSNAIAIVVTHLAGTVAVAAITDPQVGAELSTFTLTPSATLSACAAGPLAWTVSPALPAGATFNATTGAIVWTPGCSAFEAVPGGNYGPFTLTATATTGEVGSSNAFTLHINNTPVAIGAATSVAAAQVLTGNPAGDTTGIAINWTAPTGATSFKVYRAPFGHYPYYDDDGGAVPAAPGAYPPAGPWTLTGVTTSGGVDIPPARDFWYYAVYALNDCGDVSVASAVTSGTLDYHLGDVTDGFTAGQGDNLVSTADISLLGAHYGITLGADDPLGYLDVGPTTTHYVDGRPTTDRKVNFEDLVMFSINYSHVSSPALAAKAGSTAGKVGTAGKAAAAGADQLVLASPDNVAMGEPCSVSLSMKGTGAVQAMSIKLSWDPAVVKPVSQSAGDLLQQLDGVALSATPGTVDVAVLGMGRGVLGEGELANVAFTVLAAGDPKIRIETVDGRDTYNKTINVATSRTSSAPELPKFTGLMGAMPNPFRQTATVGMSLSQRSQVTLSLYSVDGALVRTLASGVYDAGVYRLAWDGRDERGAAVPAGVYYARMVAGSNKYTKILTMLK